MLHLGSKFALGVVFVLELWAEGGSAATITFCLAVYMLGWVLGFKMKLWTDN